MMTPMIDVVFLLLVFFLWTTSFQPPEQYLQGQLASAADASGTSQEEDSAEFEAVVLRIESGDPEQPAWSINGRPQHDLAAARDTLQAVARIRSDVPVVIDPAASVVMGSVVEAYDAAREAGLTQIQFAVGPGP
jgi:biopolymer transport protein ExbD